MINIKYCIEYRHTSNYSRKVTIIKLKDNEKVKDSLLATYIKDIDYNHDKQQFEEGTILYFGFLKDAINFVIKKINPKYYLNGNYPDDFFIS